jgi:hypothetical protein
VVYFLIGVVVSIVYAFASLGLDWSGVALLVCALAGALLRRRLDRESAIFIGSVAVRTGAQPPDLSRRQSARVVSQSQGLEVRAVSRRRRPASGSLAS